MSLPLLEGFVYLDTIDPTIQVSLRYAGENNFVGAPVDGYNAERVIITQPIAEKLKKIQVELKQEGYSLVVYDAYRPQMAVDHFYRWSLDQQDQKMKSWFYPHIDKSKSFELGYIARRSQHSSGNAVDISIIEIDKKLHEINPQPRNLSDGSQIMFLNDGTVDMGSSFDLFSDASHYENNLIEDKYKIKRDYLKNKMISHGFKPYSKEWWHFSLAEALFPDSYFNFPIE
jgi:D-alanyl-D-alanine dipeptidase